MEKGSQSGEKGKGAYGRRRRRNGPKSFQPPGRSEEPKLKVTDKVLKSDDKLWELYEKWCMNRTKEDMTYRFKYFKQFAEDVRKKNQAHPSGIAGLTTFADITPEELRRMGFLKGASEKSSLEHMKITLGFSKLLMNIFVLYSQKDKTILLWLDNRHNQL